MTEEKALGFDQSHVDEEGDKITLIEIALMFIVPFSLKSAVLLGLPKILKDAGSDVKLNAEEIARLITSPAGTISPDPENLDRILRILAAHKIVKEFASPSPQNPEVVERRYGSTSFLNCLTESGDGVSLAPMLHHLTEPVLLANCQLLHAPVLDKKAVPHEIVHGMNVFDWFAINPESGDRFSSAMASHTHMFMSKLLGSYKGFEGLSSVVDVGGGLGKNLALILSRNPHLRGINYDLPHVVADGVQAPRLEHVGGDFFESVPEADAVFMKWILHDWDDERCVKILKNIATALPPNGKIINIDSVLPEITDSSRETRTIACFDIHMMASAPGGKERTLRQFTKLAAEAGFQRLSVVATLEHLSVIEFYRT